MRTYYHIDLTASTAKEDIELIRAAFSKEFSYPHELSVTVNEAGTAALVKTGAPLPELTASLTRTVLSYIGIKEHPRSVVAVYTDKYAIPSEWYF